MGISEKFLEDFLCEHPEVIFGGRVEIIERQVNLRHGILDLLAWDGARVLVIELKARPLKERDIGQVLRYTHDVRMELQRLGLWESLRPPGDDRPMALTEKAFERAWLWHTDWSNDLERPVLPLLIGSAIDEKVLVAAEAAGICVHLWHHAADRFFYLEPAGVVGWGDSKHDHDPYPRWAKRIETRIGLLCEAGAERALEEAASDLFSLVKKN